MSFWGRERWLSEGKKGYKKCPVLPWDVAKVEAAGYRLSVGREYFVNEDGSSTVTRLSKKEAFVVEPGQFAFILTKEKVYISPAAIGFISIRASIKFQGLVNVSGFQVNPGFNGNLVFAVFNAGPKHITLRESDEVFSLWISDLDSDVLGQYEETGEIPNNLDMIPSKTINSIAGEALTAYQISKRVEKVEKDHQDLKLLLTKIAFGVGVGLPVLLFLFRKQLAELMTAFGNG
ncbi:dCTP deaminase domain-containing protein [Roseobacter sp.]|uniref:dCTP deaminase domain-containing protein n=1 Tax=Roseobacter sp. TaxID=1907202 RepID=UPI002966C0D3|nr:hypothetical protein [Roseobacter sp.]MDW3182658.1 hypothetical protein [Roseobacter sp.]